MIKFFIIILLSVTFATAQANEPLIISSDLNEKNHNIIAGALCNVVNSSNFNTPCFTLPIKTPKPLQGNKTLIKAQAQLAIASADHFYYHHKKNRKLLPLMGLYTETLLIVVKKNSRIEELADLKRRTVNLGVEHSSAWFTSKKFLQTIDISLTDLSSVTLLNPLSTEAKDAFCNGDIDALFLLDATPSKSMHDIISSCPAKILSLPDTLIDRITQEYPYMNKQIIAANTYHKISEIQTFGIDVLLISHRDSFTDYQGYKMVKLLVNSMKTLQRYVPSLKPNNERVLTSPTAFSPLQPGANRYFKERKRKK